MKQTVYLQLDISPQELLRYYSGSAGLVRACAHDGRVIAFPASNLRPFVTADGVHGRFRLEFDDNHRLASFSKL